MAKHPKFTISSDKKGKHRFNLTATNGQVVLTSQGYATKAGCKNGIASVRRNSADGTRFERKKSSNGKHFFNLLAANKQVVGTSQMYATKASMESGIKSVATNAAKADVEG